MALPLASAQGEGGTIEHLAAHIRERQGAANPAGRAGKAVQHLVPIRAHGPLPALWSASTVRAETSWNFRFIATRHLSARPRPFYGIQAAGVDGHDAPQSRPSRRWPRSTWPSSACASPTARTI